MRMPTTFVHFGCEIGPPAFREIVEGFIKNKEIWGWFGVYDAEKLELLARHIRETSAEKARKIK